MIVPNSCDLGLCNCYVDWPRSFDLREILTSIPIESFQLCTRTVFYLNFMRLLKI